MTDERLPKLRQAAEAMASGRFDVELPTGEDEVGRLGDSLGSLAASLGSRFDRMQRLLELTERVNAALLLEETLDYVYESFRELIPFDRIGCSLLEDGGAIIRAIWARSNSDRIELPIGYAAKMAGSSLQTIMDTAEPRILNDLEAYLRDHPKSDSTRRIVKEGIRSSLTCPLIAMGRPVGFLFFSSREVNCYADAHVDFYQQIAGLLSTVIEKSRLYQDLLLTKQKLEEANTKLAAQAERDGLTGIANRRAFDRRLDVEWRRAIRAKTPLSLVLVDVDFFKQYNDAFGHLMGDDCLRRVADTLAKAMRRAADFCARYGGEEFAVILPELARDGVPTVAKNLKRVIDELGLPHPKSEVANHVTISLGCATAIPTPESSTDELIESADQALYAAKRNGRNRFEMAPATDAAIESTAGASASEAG